MRTPGLAALFALALVPAALAAQAAHTHEGFFLSTDIGPASGEIRQTAANGPYSSATFTGSSTQWELRIGGAMATDDILSFDMSARTISNPSVSFNGAPVPFNSNSTIGDAIIGLGYTHYFMPANVFVSATLGPGDFALSGGGINGNTRDGLGFILRAGKEWWVSRHWGLGVMAGVATLSAKDKDAPAFPGYSSTFRTTQTFLTFCATFN